MRLSVSRVAAALLRGPAEARTAAPSRRRTRARARLAIALLLPAFVFVLASAWGVAEAAVPEIADPDYHLRLRIARAAQAEHPDRPLAVVIGSSRPMLASLPEHLPADADLNWVNAAHAGSGPVFNRLTLHRLLRDGVRPAVAVIEVMPPFFHKESARTMSVHLAAADLSIVRPYRDHALEFDLPFTRNRLTRPGDLARVGDPFARCGLPLPRGGWPALEAEVAPAERAKRTAFAHRMYAASLQGMTVRPTADRALRDTLRHAADSGVRVVLLRAPEGPAFRSWYDAAALARFDEYLAGVAREHAVPVIDARTWLAEEDFFDSHHALKGGAERFTTRLAREVPAALARR